MIPSSISLVFGSCLSLIFITFLWRLVFLILCSFRGVRASGRCLGSWCFLTSLIFSSITKSSLTYIYYYKILAGVPYNSLYSARSVSILILIMILTWVRVITIFIRYLYCFLILSVGIFNRIFQSSAWRKIIWNLLFVRDRFWRDLFFRSDWLLFWRGWFTSCRVFLIIQLSFLIFVSRIILMSFRFRVYSF